MPKLCAVVAYYPTYLPTAGFSASTNIKVHLAGPVSPQNEGDYYYKYEGADPGFAEHESGRYDPVSARIAWTRTIACLREGFDISRDIARVWEDHLYSKLSAKDVDKTMDTVVDRANVRCVPTLTGGLAMALPTPQMIEISFLSQWLLIRDVL